MSEANFVQDGCKLDHTAVAALKGGDVFQLADGRAAVVPTGVDAGRVIGASVEGVYEITKTTGINLLYGGDVYWDVSAGKAHFRPESGTPDFFVGVCVKDAASADTTVKVAINTRGKYIIDLASDHEWTAEATNGLGVIPLPGATQKLEFDAVAEAAQAAILSNHAVPKEAGPILEARVAVFNIGDNAALDIDIGVASSSHATDFEAIANLVAAHLDGTSLDIKVHSDDGTTDVAPVDSTIDAVDDTFFELWIDCRNPADVQVYVNGVDAVPAGTTLALAAATNAMKAIAHMEKTSDDTVADVRISRLRVRTSTE